MKKELIDKKCFQSVWGTRIREWVLTPANGSAGGMLVAWNKDSFVLLSIEYGIYSLSVKLFNRSLGFTG